MTGYALGVAIGGPVLGVATMRFDCRRLLLFLVCIFLAGNIVCAIAPTMAMMNANESASLSLMVIRIFRDFRWLQAQSRPVDVDFHAF